MRPTVAWGVLALLPNLVWEVLQLPLYTLWHDPDRLRVVAYLLHCTAGDGLIATGSYVVASLVAGSTRWPLGAPGRGVAALLVAGLAYTAYSEWNNVHQLNNWSYRDAMPTLWGVGLAPLAQWVVVPGLMLAATRIAWVRGLLFGRTPASG